MDVPNKIINRAGATREETGKWRRAMNFGVEKGKGVAGGTGEREGGREKWLGEKKEPCC